MNVPAFHAGMTTDTSGSPPRLLLTWRLAMINSYLLSVTDSIPPLKCPSGATPNEGGPTAVKHPRPPQQERYGTSGYRHRESRQCVPYAIRLQDGVGLWRKTSERAIR